ncbi:NADH-ubiquinone dehydrogenase [Striga asiatica]|uniref:NADH-ubiquinone dehydrogenase n=1 Tax=Striga asiatica TaxID=4170 RepID=A0A5A7NVA4_STRAF|nr:NADH-ubiquinone dehydrogenase [Striga asiatica]
MGSKSLILLIWLIIIVFSNFVCSTNCRKLIIKKEPQDKSSVQRRPPPPADSLFLAALPKGKVPSSTPSKKGHATTTDQKLISRHLADVGWILRSFRSPDAGH